MYGCLTVLVSALWGGAVGVETGKGVCYTVSQVNAVEVSTAFTCRLRDYVWPTQVQFKVQLRNLEDAADPNAAQAARRFLYERLTNARQIRLAAVRDYGYFRLAADVIVDGRDVVAEMVEYGLMRPPLVTVEMQKKDTVSAKSPVLSDITGYSEASRDVGSTPISVRPQTIRQLLAQEADLSRMGSETTLQEALSILSEATRPRLPMLILWNDLRQNAFIDRDMPIGIDGFGKMRLDKALELILHAVAPSSVSVVAVDEGGVLTIATRHGVIEKPRIGVYSVTDLFAAPSEDRQQQTGSGGIMSP